MTPPRSPEDRFAFLDDIRQLPSLPQVIVGISSSGIIMSSHRCTWVHSKLAGGAGNKLIHPDDKTESAHNGDRDRRCENHRKEEKRGELALPRIFMA